VVGGVIGSISGSGSGVLAVGPGARTTVGCGWGDIGPKEGSAVAGNKGEGVAAGPGSASDDVIEGPGVGVGPIAGWGCRVGTMGSCEGSGVPGAVAGACSDKNGQSAVMPRFRSFSLLENGASNTSCVPRRTQQNTAFVKPPNYH